MREEALRALNLDRLSDEQPFPLSSLNAQAMRSVLDAITLRYRICGEYLYNGKRIIESLLDRICLISPPVRAYLEKQHSENLQKIHKSAEIGVNSERNSYLTTNQAGLSAENERDQQKKKAEERRRAVLAAMAAKQKAFLGARLDEQSTRETTSNPPASTSSTSQGALQSSLESNALAHGGSDALDAHKQPEQRLFSHAAHTNDATVQMHGFQASAPNGDRLGEGEGECVTCVICNQMEQLAQHTLQHPVAAICFMQPSSLLLHRPATYAHATHYQLHAEQTDLQVHSLYSRIAETLQDLFDEVFFLSSCSHLLLHIPLPSHFCSFSHPFSLFYLPNMSSPFFVDIVFGFAIPTTEIN